MFLTTVHGVGAPGLQRLAEGMLERHTYTLQTAVQVDEV